MTDATQVVPIWVKNTPYGNTVLMAVSKRARSRVGSQYPPDPFKAKLYKWLYLSYIQASYLSHEM